MLLMVLLQFSPLEITQRLLARFDGIIYDNKMRHLIPAKLYDNVSIVIIDIDEKSIKEEGRFPWSRRKVAQLINQLSEAGVIMTAFDVLFSESERHPLDEINTVLQEKSQQIPENLLPLRPVLDADLAMTEAMTEHEVILGTIFQQDEMVRINQLPQTTSLVFQTPEHAPSIKHLTYTGFTTSLPALNDVSAGFGFINAINDPDGFIRKGALLIEHGGKFYPSLSVEMARLYMLLDETIILTNEHGEQPVISGLKLGELEISTDARGQVLIPYVGPQRSFPYISATDVLKGTVDPDILSESLAIVGTSAVGLSDLRTTPVGVLYPGVEVHANLLNALIHPENMIARPDWWQGATLLILLFIGLLMAFIYPMLGPLVMLACSLFILMGLIGSNLYLWQKAHLDLPLASSLYLLVFGTLFYFLRGFLMEASSRRQIKGIFDQYVPPAHIDEMLEHPEMATLEGERREMTVLFSDIRSFTSISEKLSANELKNMLNRYFSPITKIIFENQGTIDKYVGDMVMAFWNAPLTDPKHAENCVIAAFEMQRQTALLRDEFWKDHLPQVYVGIGINTGFMNVGDMGSEYRRAYTVLGDAVNLGSRLEGLTKFYGVEILISESTKALCPKILCKTVDKVKVKGKDEAVTIYEPIDTESEESPDKEEVTLHEQGFNAYLEQNWEKALFIFNDLHKRSKNTQLYSMYIERIDALKSQQLPADWDGSFTHTSK